ncbi:hypothetical protein [Streptomyces sp. NPDC050264]|uniref:hypothetical protein n=1 Tax=Streptomyces sp. NPDC050264 TaxID=3155038 RepID=UPI0034443FB5
MGKAELGVKERAMVVRNVERLRVVEETIAQLRAELGVLGVLLPSLRVDPMSVAGEAGFPLVDLGRVNLDTAMRMVAVLHERNGR